MCYINCGVYSAGFQFERGGTKASEVAKSEGKNEHG